MAENRENQKGASNAEDVKPQRLLLFEQLVKKAEHSIPEVDDFLIKVTSILDLKQLNIDIVNLDKFFEVWLCLISPRMTKENSLIFEDGTCFTRQQLELIYGIDFVNAFVPFLLSLQSFSQIELKLFTTVAVLSRTISDFYYPSRIYLFRDDRAVQKLKDFCVGLFDCDISQKLLRLWELVEQHNDATEWLRMNYWPNLKIAQNIAPRLKIQLPILRSEMDFKGLSSAEIDELKKSIIWEEWAGKTLQSYIETQISFARVCLESLSTYDQACLIKHGLIETWFCSVSPYMTRNAIVLRPTGYTRMQLERIYRPDFVNAFTETLLSLQAYQLSTLEMKLFQDIVLLNQRPGLVDVEAVQKLQDRAIEKFTTERFKNQKNTNDVDIPTLDIPQMLSKLRSLSLLHLNSLDWLKENSKKVGLTALFCELFDIPNCIFENV